MRALKQHKKISKQQEHKQSSLCWFVLTSSQQQHTFNMQLTAVLCSSLLCFCSFVLLAGTPVQRACKQHLPASYYLCILCCSNLNLLLACMPTFPILYTARICVAHTACLQHFLFLSHHGAGHVMHMLLCLAPYTCIARCQHLSYFFFHCDGHGSSSTARAFLWRTFILM